MTTSMTNQTMTDRIGVGWTVMSDTRSHGGFDPLTGEILEPFGGVVVEVREPRHDDDPITYVCFNPDVWTSLEFRTVAEHEVDPTKAAEPNITEVTKAIRRMGGALALTDRHGRRKRSKDLSEHEVNMVTYMVRLVAVVGSCRPPRYYARATERFTPPPAPGGCFVD